MVNLPQDLLTVGSNVCDFWIWLTFTAHHFEKPLIPSCFHSQFYAAN